MAKHNISKLVSERQIEHLHEMMDCRYDNLSSDHISLLDSLLSTVTTALHRNIPIHLRSTDHFSIGNVAYLHRPSYFPAGQRGLLRGINR